MPQSSRHSIPQPTPSPCSNRPTPPLTPNTSHPPYYAISNLILGSQNSPSQLSQIPNLQRPTLRSCNQRLLHTPVPTRSNPETPILSACLAHNAEHFHFPSTLFLSSMIRTQFSAQPRTSLTLAAVANHLLGAARAGSVSVSPTSSELVVLLIPNATSRFGQVQTRGMCRQWES